MSSPSRTALLHGLEGLRAASLEPVVRGSNPAGEILRRGLAVSSYNLLETFVEGRLHELANYINQGTLHFSDLPDMLQKRATRTALEVGTSRIKRMAEPDVRNFIRGVGESVAAIDGPIKLSPLTWLWPGSNMGASDFAGILRSFHVKTPWTEVDALSLALGLPATSSSTLSAESQFKDFVRERHSAAHNPSHHVSNLQIPLSIDLLTKFAVAFDVFASVAAQALKQGTPGYLVDENWTPGRVGFRQIRERSNDWAEFSATGSTAYRVGKDLHGVTVGAASRCGASDALVVLKASGEVHDWSIPAVS